MQELADHHWTKAYSYYLSVHALIQQVRNEAEGIDNVDVEKVIFNGHYSPAIHLLASYSLELLLKAVCILHGSPEQRLKKWELRHDLTGLLKEAQKLGFSPLDNSLDFVADRLRDPHLSHQFRYGGKDVVVMPELAITTRVLKSLIGQIRLMLDGAT